MSTFPVIRLDGKVAIVTGGGRGIGEGICLALADKGADILVADIDWSAARNTAEKVKSLGRKGVAIKTDVSRSDEVNKMVDTAVEGWGKVDVLVNNAGTIKTSVLVELEEKDWDRVMDVNAKGVFLCCKMVAKHMIAHGKGKITNIASIAAKKGEPYNSVYCASKAAVMSITQSLALELASYGINVNAICPGSIDTQLLRGVIAERGPLYGLTYETYREQLIKQIPLGRMGEPNDVAKVAVFLASEYSDYMTGQAINVTGGLIFY